MKSHSNSVRSFLVASLSIRSVMAAALLLLPLSAMAKDHVPIKGSFHTIHEDTFGFVPGIGPIVSVVVEGSGQVSHMGRATCFTDDQLGVLMTGALSATYTVTAANGDTLVLWLEGPSELDFPTVTFSGAFAVLGGTGRFANATGSGVFSGWAVFEEPFGLPTNHGPGFFAIDGVVSSPGESRK